MLFEYKAKNLNAETVEGTLEAINQSAAVNILVSRKMIIISLKESGALPIWRRPLHLSFLERVSQKDMVFMSRQLSVMVLAGLPLVKALEVLARQTNRAFLKQVINIISEDVRGGTRFSTALANILKFLMIFMLTWFELEKHLGNLMKF